MDSGGEEDQTVSGLAGCYRWLQGEFVSHHSSFWKRLWSLKAPEKVVNSLWRVCRGCLPTTTALAMKHVDIDVNYLCCHREAETSIHTLFECDFARTVWQSSAFKSLVQSLPGESILNVLICCFSTCTRDQSVLVGMICWSLWNRRNKWVWEKVSGSAFGVLASALNLLQDWREAQASHTSVENRKRAMTDKQWRKPATGWLKINWDASGVVNGSIDIDCVIRDSQGNFVGARCCRKEGAWQSREAEALNLKEAISWTQLLDFKHCIFETDLETLTMACTGKEGESCFHTIVSDCIHASKHFDNVLVIFTYMSVNRVAHLLANTSHSMRGPGSVLPLRYSSCT